MSFPIELAQTRQDSARAPLTADLQSLRRAKDPHALRSFALLTASNQCQDRIVASNHTGPANTAAAIALSRDVTEKASAVIRARPGRARSHLASRAFPLSLTRNRRQLQLEEHACPDTAASLCNMPRCPSCASATDSTRWHDGQGNPPSIRTKSNYTAGCHGRSYADQPSISRMTVALPGGVGYSETETNTFVAATNIRYPRKEHVSLHVICIHPDKPCSWNGYMDASKNKLDFLEPAT